jgi:hypothetical protein
MNSSDAKLLSMMWTFADRLTRSDKASERTWGKHLLDDWRSLELLVQGLDEVEEVPATESLVEETPVQATGV